MFQFTHRTFCVLTAATNYSRNSSYDNSTIQLRFVRLQVFIKFAKKKNSEL